MEYIKYRVALRAAIHGLNYEPLDDDALKALDGFFETVIDSPMELSPNRLIDIAEEQAFKANPKFKWDSAEMEGLDG